jgi:O-antigen biosynthesis alpha-1,2-rhamnosyltransferase
MRVFIECTDTYLSGFNTGIQRFVRNFVRHATSGEKIEGVSCSAVIVENGGMRQLANIDERRLKNPRPTLRQLLNRAYFYWARTVISVLPFELVERLLLAHPSQPGLPKVLFAPFRLLSQLNSRMVRPVRPAPNLADTLTAGDVVFFADGSWSQDVFDVVARAKLKGARVGFMIQDIIPLTHPQLCHPITVERFREWFWKVIDTTDLLICPSHATKQTITTYLEEHKHPFKTPIRVVYLGRDLGTAPKGEMSHRTLHDSLTRYPASFLCVGTLEPRKNLDVVIDAFESLWADDEDVCLILIGREGWLCDDLMARLRGHPQCGKRLLWLNDVDDRNLALAYRKATALIFPSLVEGFGLPLVEALDQGLPVLASDIPVFREIVGAHARFFPPSNAAALETAVRALLSAPAAPKPTFQWLTWEESTRHLLLTLQAPLDSDRT